MTGKSAVRSSGWIQVLVILLGVVGLLGYTMSKFINGRLIVAITVCGALGFIIALVFLARRLREPRRVALAVVVSLVMVCLVSYGLLFATIVFFQDLIANETSAFFQPKVLSAEAAQALISPRVEALNLTTPDGARLRGWLVHNAESGRSPLVIYFGGSGSESSEMIPYMEQLQGWSVALVNYRGYGLSQGVPSQAHVFADATYLYGALLTRPDVDGSHIVAMGYSLGTGVAVYLSEQRPVVGTVLVAPYDTMTLIGVKEPPVFAPLFGVMKHYFDSVSRAPAITTPALFLVGSADTAIVPERSFRLASHWGGKTTVKTYAGENHSLLLHVNNCWADIAAFLTSLGLQPAPTGFGF